MTEIADNNRYAPPKAELVEPGSVDNKPELAGRGLRLVAVILDGLLMSLIQWPLYLVFGGMRIMAAMSNPQEMTDPLSMLGQMFAAMAPGWIIAAAVQMWCLHAYGGTLAKKILGLRIVRSDGTRAGFARLFFGRGGAAVLPMFVPLLNLVWWLLDPLLIFRESRQCLHDQIADTIVVTASSSMSASLEASRTR